MSADSNSWTPTENGHEQLKTVKPARLDTRSGASWGVPLGRRPFSTTDALVSSLRDGVPLEALARQLAPFAPTT